MPTLNWIGKEKIVNHDKEVPFRLLKKNKALSLGTSENLIIEGDNLEALKALMPYYVGKVKCIYIDPPYNTGNEGWVYNDNVNSPKIKQWIGKVVGSEGEDLTRHDKWLCMMYPRLKLLRDLLSDDGSIFIQIDGNEAGNLRLLMDEIFGEENYKNQITWLRSSSGKTVSRNLSEDTDYIFWYSKSDKYIFNQVFKPLSENTKAMYNKDDNDGRGVYRLYPLQKTGGPGPETTYDYKDNKGKTWACPIKGWRMRYSKLKALENDGRLYFEGKKLSEKAYWNERENEGQIANNLWNDIFNLQGNNKEKLNFDGQKPTLLIERVITMAMGKNGIVLDSFAGTGTTAESVLKLNKRDAGKRKFILVEMEKGIAEKITAERVRRVSKGLNGNFEYCTLGNKLFNAGGAIDEEVAFNDLANYIYFTETQTNLEKKQISGNFIGEHNENDFYLLFKEKGKNTLTKSFIKNVTKNNHKKVIYADFCTISDDILQAHNITFKQIPYEVKVY